MHERATDAPSGTDARGAGRPALRFVVAFAAWIAALELGQFVLLPEGAYHAYLEANAIGATLLLDAAGLEVERFGRLIAHGASTLEVAAGCDATQPVYLFVAGVLAFPAAWRSRLAAALGGLLVLVGVNLVRIASLVWIHGRSEELFDLLHLTVWPALIVLLALVLWVAWTARVLRPGGTSATPP